MKTWKKGLLYCLPFFLFLVAVICFCLYCSSSLYLTVPELIVPEIPDGIPEEEAPVLIEPDAPEQDIVDGLFPIPAYGSQWATLNVDGWETRDIPVYYGDGMTLLRSGALLSQFSPFPGQNGKAILSAHVNRHFYEIEDSAARFANGEEVLVTLDTKWGTYVYRVVEAPVFGYQDPDVLKREPGKETLFMYTCYPRENSLEFKTERIALKCELVSGATWRDYVK